MNIIFNAIALGKRIKYIRKQKGLSQTALSYPSATSQTRLSELERGNISSLNICKLNQIAQALKTNLDVLLCDSLDVFADPQNQPISTYQLKLKELLTTLEKKTFIFI